MILNDVKVKQKKTLDENGEETNKVQNYISIGNIIFIGEKDGINKFPKNIQNFLTIEQNKKGDQLKTGKTEEKSQVQQKMAKFILSNLSNHLNIN